jgi:hypothetical protein
MTELALRPRSSTEIIDLAVRLLRRHFGAFFTISLVGLVPSLLLQVVILTTVFAGLTTDPGSFSFARVGATAFLAYPVVILALTLMLASLYAAGDQALREGTVDVGAAVRRGVRRLGASFGVLILSGLAIGFGFLFLFAPGVYLTVRLATAQPAAATEDVGVVDALRRAWERGEGQWGHTFLTLLLAGLLFFVFLVVAQIVALVGGLAFGGRVATLVVTQVLNTLALAAAYPLLTCAVLVLTYDLRVRREGYDVEAMAAALGTAG